MVSSWIEEAAERFEVKTKSNKKVLRKVKERTLRMFFIF